jgi:transposase
VPENIRLIEQPPRSPELNPTEHIWEEVREKHFYNQVFASLATVTDTLCQGLHELMETPEKLCWMTSFPHLRVVL